MEALETRLAAYLEKSGHRYCVLFVNDGSKDDSLELIKKICENEEDFYYISLHENRGLSTALKAGIDTTESRLIGYIDGDLQTDPEDFDLLLAYAGEYELVTGIRARRKDSWSKRMQSKFANNFRKAFTHDGATDTGCPLKVLDAATAKRIPFFNGMHRFLAAMVQLQGGKMREVAVRHYPRVAGVSKYHLWNRLGGPLMDCFAYLWMKKNYINYSVGQENINGKG